MRLFKIFGQKIIGSEIYLVAQLSQGEDVGDRGLFYLPREVVNKEIGAYGIFMFYDMEREEAERIILKKKVFGGNIFSNLWSFLTGLFHK